MTPHELLAEDLLEVLDPEEICREFEVEGGSRRAARDAFLAHAVTAPREELAAELADIVGRPPLRRLIERLGIPSAPRESSADMVDRWLTHRGLPACSLPRAAPQSMVREIIEQLVQAASHLELYDLGKSIPPEMERLLRMVAMYYLQTFEAASRVRELDRVLEEAARRAWIREWTPVAARELEVHCALELLTMGALFGVVDRLGRCPTEPFRDEIAGFVELLTPEEERLAREVVRLRNVHEHGTSWPETDSVALRECVLRLLRSWSQREVVPRGAVLDTIRRTPGATNAQGVDEYRQSVLIYLFRNSLEPADCVLLPAPPSQLRIRGDRIEALPSKWWTPRRPGGTC